RVAALRLLAVLVAGGTARGHQRDDGCGRRRLEEPAVIGHVLSLLCVVSRRPRRLVPPGLVTRSRCDAGLSEDMLSVTHSSPVRRTTHGRPLSGPGREGPPGTSRLTSPAPLLQQQMWHRAPPRRNFAPSGTAISLDRTLG